MNRIVIPSLMLALAGFHAQATVLLSDTFTYPDGPIVGAPNSPWVANTGTAGTALVTNGMLEWSFSRSEDIAGPLATTITPTSAVAKVYASFKIKFSALPSATGTYFAHCSGTNLSTHRCRIWASTANAASGKFRLGVANSSGGSAASGQWASDLDLDATYKVVVRYDVASGLSTIWIDPTAESDTGVTASDAVGIADIANYAFRQASGIGNSRIDDLLVGTSFSDVAGANSPPTISSIPSQRTAANTPSPAVAFTVGDTETPAGDLTLSAESSNPTLVPPANVTFGGSGTDRTVTVTPAPGEQGTANITVTVTDGGGASASTSFSVAVGLPSISDIPNQSTPTNTPTPAIAFTISDTETAADDLTLTAASSNTGLVPVENIVFGGSGSNRTVTVTPATDVVGSSLVTITVSDGTVSASDSFILNVFPVFGVIKFDDFARADGPVVDGSGLWLNHSGTFQEAQIVNQQLRLTFSGSEDVSTELDSRPYGPSSGALLYASFKVTFTTLPSSSGSYFAHFKDDGASNFRCRIFAQTAGAASGAFRLGLANAAAGASVVFPRDLALGATYTVVTRYNTATGVSTLWIDPDSEESPSVTATDTPSTMNVHTYAFRQASGIGILLVDDLKVAGNFTDASGFRLRIVRGTDVVEVRWPVGSVTFTLQYKEELAPGTWTDYTDPPFVDGNENVVYFSSTTGNRFFRLYKP